MPHPLVVHCRKDVYDVYVGRPSIYGNPFSHEEGTLAQYRVATRDDAIYQFALWLPNQPELMALLPQLKGKRLGCWCAPKKCHGDVIAILANDYPI